MKKRTLSRQEQKLQTRQALIKTATRLFAQKGILGTSTMDLAKAAKVSHGTVFLHFPERDELILAVIDDFGAKLSLQFGGCMQQGKLKDLLLFHLEVLAQYEDFYHHLISELGQLPPRVKSLVFMLHAAVSWKLFETAKILMEKGQLKKMTRPLLFNTWIALVQYYVTNRELLGSTLPILIEKKEELVEHFISLIQTHKGERK